MDTIFALDALASPYDVLNGGIGIVLPLLVALITKRVAHPQLKALCLLVLSALASVVVTATLFSAGLGWEAFLGNFSTIFTAAIVAHFGVWRKGLGDYLSTLTAHSGIGPAGSRFNTADDHKPGYGVAP